ncbi:MAG TPA: folylpolyglutamate synthase/dihydrofolate synthase family protein [Agriterribacter sp.]|nr:bifunctional folylpolyglutamate synthase/dihydrofolate synthase [Chitinophagaceae bacterium]HRP30278.1 folylpolyglutamate synthase/dihydrofolate synthase family protein [Agriterribacter sp.]
MNYNKTIEFLYKALPMFSHLGAAAMKKDLTNTTALCRHLGNPQNTFRSVHIAGTNGKGSVSHMLAAVLQTAGYKTGLYTSPHLRDFRERIKVNGVMIEQDFVVSFTEKMKPLIAKLRPSFFEITVAMMFEYFSIQKVDIAVIETGLGGRLDSTNVIVPELSVITNIGMDHMHILGNTLGEIAFEKAGIIKPGVPVVAGEVLPQTESVFAAVAAKNGSLMIQAAQRRFADAYSYDKKMLSVDMVHLPDRNKQTYRLDLPGVYQVKNLITTLAAIDQLRLSGWKIPEQCVQQGMAHVRKLTGLHGRWEIIREQPAVVLDVAHNEDGMKQVVAQLELTDYRRLHIVIGMVKDKEVEKVIQLLPKDAAYYFTKAQIPRAMPEEQLAAIAAAHGLHGHSFSSVQQAVQDALGHAHNDDLILVCGSVFVVGEVNLS